MNPLQKARWRASHSWRTARDGTKRTAGWVTGGFGGRIASLWRSSGGRLAQGIGSRPRVAILWAAGALLILAWIGWTVYVWIENGAGAGIGVLISWPAVFAALALIASAFVGAGLLVRRNRVAADGPAMAETTEVADTTEAMEAGDDPEYSSEGDDGSADDEPQDDSQSS